MAAYSGGRSLNNSTSSAVRGTTLLGRRSPVPVADSTSSSSSSRDDDDVTIVLFLRQ